jgi:hypothetical protein
MTGNEGTPGAGRTASGLSMMIGNASKIIKQVVTGVDTYILTPLLERLYYYNMRYGTDPDLKGDVNVMARGAMSLTAKEAAQVRRNEFLANTNNPVDIQIIGLEGRAEVLRSAARSLDMNPDKIVPPLSVIRQRQAQALMMQQQMAAAQGPAGPGAQQQGAKPGVPPHQQAPHQQPPRPGGGQQLMNGAPTADHFQPAAA